MGFHHKKSEAWSFGVRMLPFLHCESLEQENPELQTVSRLKARNLGERVSCAGFGNVWQPN